MILQSRLSISIVFLSLFLGVSFVTYASITDGTIDSTHRYAWSENVGWIDFGTTLGNVRVTDSGLTGYAYGENVGWISLNCSNTSTCETVSYGVTNTAAGVLSGYAWSENVGWINFNPTGGGVMINNAGEFFGSAYGENIGWIIFNCSTTASCGSVNYLVSTDWRPVSARPVSPEGTFIGPRYGSGGAAGPVPMSLMNVPTTQPSTATLNTPALTVNTFKRDLGLNSRGEDVRQLQIHLNAQGFVVAKTGPGSLGKETTLFGPATKAALLKYQKAKGIKPLTGYFGPITRGYLIK